VIHNASVACGIVATAFSGWFLYSGSQFLLQPSATAARRLLIVSIVYLPALLVLLVFSST
jgi:heme O synthase-like polyprenyltransferase